MATRPWTVGIVGCGTVAGLFDAPASLGPVRTHAQAFHRHAAFDLVAAVDPDEARAEAFAAAWNIGQRYSSAAELLADRRLDVICITSRDAAHAANAMDVLRSDQPPACLVIEKPVTHTREELDAIIEVERRTKTRVGVNHHRRFDVAHQSLKELIRAGDLGPMVEGAATYYGGWAHNGTHLVDTLRMLFGDTIRVDGAQSAGGEDLRVELSVAGAKLTALPFQGRYQIFESELRFADGRVLLQDFGDRVVVQRVANDNRGDRVLTNVATPSGTLGQAFVGLTEAVDACLSGQDAFGELGVDLASAAATMSIIWEAKEIAASHPGGAR